ncbi:hypothetical protein KQX54_013104 [Cotesia glomerata]|uniref:DUF4771 domain-containing protein n=1 Tax=Cotesia glomerata TaxID=32391 RepID=A0AAV7IR71_COTGL|nr:hypothetical protein KQX54_013104 [Cotesia glomerata]
MNPGKFLCEIYRSITGNYFEEERNKKFYDCNQRLVLTAIAYLYLPETIIELHRRLPITKKNDSSYSKKYFPPVKSQQKSSKSPYLQSRLEEYNLILQKNEQLKSQKMGQLIAKPQVILPPSDLVLKSEQLKRSSQKNLKKNNSQSNYKKLRSYSSKSIAKKNSSQLTARTNYEKKIEFNEYDPSIVKIFKENEEKKNTFRLKDNFFTLSENSFKINEIKNLRGRKYLSRNWEESLRNVDEDFVIMSRKANDILKNFYNTTCRIFNVDLCSHCCSQKSKIPTKKKIKNLLIDSLILDGNCRRKFIGSVTLNSPSQSLPASEHSFSQEITLSEDKLIKKNIICGSIIIDGKLINQIGGICKDRLHISHKIPHSERIKNTLPCNCYCTEENKEENETENKIDKLKCQQRFDDINPSLKNFLLANEVKKNIEEQTFERINHTTCTQRFFTDKKKVEEKKKEACMKCFNFPDKCKKNPLEEILKFVEEDQIKLYKNNIKFSIRGLKQIADNGASCKPIISNIILCTPKIITPISSKSDLTVYSSLSKSNLVSEIKLNGVKNEGEKLSGKEKIAKIITDNKNKVKEEMMELYKQIEELDNIKNKLNKNLEIIKSDPAIKDTSVIKKQIAGKNVKMKKKDIKLKETDNKANSEKFENENLETIETDSKNVIKKQIVDGKNNMKMKKKLMSEETGDTDVYSEKSEGDKKNSDLDKNIINEEKNDGDLSKHNNLITLMKIALKEMANENFLLAKLPDCDKLPQLRMWIKCRKGFVSSNLEKDELRDKIQNIGNEQFDETSKIVVPQIKLDKYQGTLNYYDINKLENLVKMKKKQFYSKVRKSRVNVSRSTWNQLQFDNCTSDLLFKRTYFIYQPAKEANGFILKPYGLQSSKKKEK